MPVNRLPVAVELPQHAGLSALLEYQSEQELPPGTLVRVPLGKREVPGIVWSRATDQPAAEDQLRPVAEVMEGLPPLSTQWMQLVDFAAAYYQRHVGELALSVLPPELRKSDDRQLGRRLTRLLREPPPATPPTPATAPELSPDQQAAVQALAQGPAATTLLHGVTGSGKTEVYLQAAERALAAGGQVLVLVPEINLTPQLEARFAARFPGRSLVSLHSGLTAAQRLNHWLLAHLGRADLVLGTRLAVFASMPRLALIVVDEEHDPSFKQQEGARYSARDLAVYRGHLEGRPVVLGSATPSLESWQRADEGRYRRLTLAARIGQGAMPRVRLLDTNALPRQRGVLPPLAAPVLDAVRQRIERGEQSLVLLNRRGYAPVLHCHHCQWKSECEHCSARRVFHKADRTLRCHHCGFTEAVPRACPVCGNLDIAPIGRGTEKLEEQIAELLPGARVARIDADSTRPAGELERQLAAVHDGEVDVLVGTQMVAKGHDFRRMTLVAAVNADGALFSSDFRAPERLFALLMQAAGRAGRDAEQAARSEVWIQTAMPQHPLYQALVRHDYAAFAASQLDERRRAGLPPFSSLALVRAEAREAAVATAYLQAAAEAAATLPEGEAVSIYPPVPPAVSRVAGIERMQMLVESASRGALQRFLAAWVPQLHALRPGVKGLARWAIDVDPLAI
ncbi:MAG: primosomal protein N' [Rubrivivax sp.]|nr:primosomal protein N' [Rubrivivax sp.]